MELIDWWIIAVVIMVCIAIYFAVRIIEIIGSYMLFDDEANGTHNKKKDGE